MIRLALVVAGLAGALSPAALAGPMPISIEDRGDRVSIFLAGASTNETRMQSRGDRVELPLDQPLPAIELKLEDPTVRKVELRARPPSVRIQLRHGSESTRIAGEMAEVRPVAGGIEIILPRVPRQAAQRAAAVAAGAAAVAAGSAPPAPSVGAAPPASMLSAPPASPALGASAPLFPPTGPLTGQPASAGPASPSAPILPPRERAPLDREEPPSSSSPLGTLFGFAGLLSLAAAGVLVYRRRRSIRTLASPLEIMAQVAVGPRARVVWLSAGRREMLISVSDKDVRVLGQWLADVPRADATAAAEPAGELRQGIRAPDARLRTNPSLSGLIRLRDQHAAIENGESAQGTSPGAEAPGEEPDAEWARQLVAATRRGVLR